MTTPPTYAAVPMRDLNLAREAYGKNDPELSRFAHTHHKSLPSSSSSRRHRRASRSQDGSNSSKDSSDNEEEGDEEGGGGQKFYSAASSHTNFNNNHEKTIIPEMNSPLLHRKRFPHEERHKSAADWLGSCIFGGMDGIVTMFALVSGALGGGVSLSSLIILAFSSLISNAVSMGVGDAISEKAHLDYVKQERRREMWETENYKEGEVEEMIDLYVAKGMAREDAEIVIPIMAKNNEFFVDLMLVEELGLQPPSEDDNPWKEGLVTFVAFIIFGLAPLIGYAILTTVVGDQDVLFVVAIILTALTLFGLGCLKSKFSTMHWFHSGMETLIFGGIVAIVAYFIGFFVSELAPETGGLH